MISINFGNNYMSHMTVQRMLNLLQYVLQYVLCVKYCIAVMLPAAIPTLGWSKKRHFFSD